MQRFLLNRFKIAGLAVLLLSMVACQTDGPQVPLGDPAFGQAGVLITYKGKPFTGTMYASKPELGLELRMHYRDGLQHGLATEMRKGKPVMERRYYKGMKHGLHRTWYPDGKPHSYQQFKWSVPTGEKWVWHSNGRVVEYLLFYEEGQAVLHKRLRRTGQSYMIVVFLNGEALGMPGTKFCCWFCK